MSGWVPSRKVGAKAAIFKLLAIGFCSSSFLGCSALSVRSDNCSQCVASRQAEVFNAVDCETCQSSDPCDDQDYQPMLPQIPLPGCLHKWKEQRDLPDGPQGLKFHPLPTRPMFQPRPGALPLSPPWNCPSADEQATGEPAPLPIDSTGYGGIPLRSQWGELQPQLKTATPAPDSIKNAGSKARAGTRNEELPQPQ